MKLTQNLSPARLSDIKNLYVHAFPAAERKPFYMIHKKQAEGSMEILSIENDTGDFLGLAITILYKDIVLLDYFAVDDNQRNNGAGSSALRMLLERYLGKRFLLEIEAPDIPSEKHSRAHSKKSILPQKWYGRHAFPCQFFRNCNGDFDQWPSGNL